MKSIQSGLNYRFLTVFMAGAVLWALCLAGSASAQAIYQPGGIIGTIDAGTMINVRTNEPINARNAEGRVYSGVVNQDVLDRHGRLAIPRGSPAELIVRRASNRGLVLDLESVVVNGVRYGIESEADVVGGQPGLGANQRTGEYVGGGAVLGAIVGAIAGGGKGAAIGAGAGAAAGAGAQVLTQGNTVRVPPESLLTFQLTRPLRAGVVDNGYTAQGFHYHRGYDNPQSSAYQAGVRQGRLDAERNLRPSAETRQWRSDRDRNDYASGYNDGYYQESASYNGRQKPAPYNNGRATLSVQPDKSVRWQGPENASIYVQMDNQAPKLFASGQSGVQNAPWLNQGHLYVFTMRDANGNEIARVNQDLRR
jgi:hypothetical protein